MLTMLTGHWSHIVTGAGISISGMSLCHNLDIFTTHIHMKRFLTVHLPANILTKLLPSKQKGLREDDYLQGFILWVKRIYWAASHLCSVLYYLQSSKIIDFQKSFFFLQSVAGSGVEATM